MNNKHKKHKFNYKFIIGIDEAGRGPLAGPVCVGAVAATGIRRVRRGRSDVAGRTLILLKNIKDSKKLSAVKREEWEKIIKKNFESHFVFVSHKTIDKIGISQALKLGVRRVLEKFSQKSDLVLMDGSLRAPKEYRQKTIIKGDEKVPLISAASIIAKTARDKKMFALDKKYPQYNFAKHKGYGTKAHYKKIKKYGLCNLHRKTFCKNIGTFNNLTQRLFFLNNASSGIKPLNLFLGRVSSKYSTLRVSSSLI